MNLSDLWSVEGRSRLRFNAMRHEWYEDFADHLDDGEPVVEGIRRAARRAQERKTGLDPVFRTWLAGLASKPLSEAARVTVPPTDVMILGAYERLHQLSTGMRYLGSFIREQLKIKRALTLALIGPAVATTIITLLLMMISFKAVPMLARLLPPSEWHRAAWLLLQVADLVSNWGWLLATLSACLVVTWWLSLDRWAHPLRLKLDHWLPLYAWRREAQSVIFLNALQAVLQSRPGLVKGLRIVRANASPWLALYIDRMLFNIERRNLDGAHALDVGLFSPRLMDRILDFSGRNGFEQALAKLAAQEFQRLGRSLENVTLVIGYVSLGGIALMLILMILGFGDIALSLKAKFDGMSRH
ncbi:type II secretion system F family protein [Parachitinimonas caeni]|uniref:Type II secretion system F family protein n=1 Tax=Parachitinimonas caeni TaxID=3031301 RepID=A0ABT7E5S3_9NEIS|nr:type II secretion system F family protein [Parachitinimonas caeni]MDK2126713.1 type II secretion system F family protein [Parachitinimonas caeni]